MSTLPRVAIAGATGFVGRALVCALAPRHRVIALCRSVDGAAGDGNVDVRPCDLFDLGAAKAALEGADVAVYLVHSMLPQARLTQARFEDLDLICADNFARAAAAKGLRYIVYLGGLLPRDTRALSRHLRSRREVEQTLGAYGVPVTTLRAGLVIGAGGSSFEMMAKLVRKLPIMVTPRWTRTVSQPIDLEDVIPLLEYAVASPELAGRAYDIGGPDVVSYADMLRRVGRVLGRRTRVLTLPVRTAKLSLLWVSAITGAPHALVRPLVESLSHDMVVEDGGILQKRAGLSPRPLDVAIARAVEDERGAGPDRPNRTGRRRSSRTVCSVQRLPLGRGRDARWVAEEYLRWLPRFLGPLLRIHTESQDVCRFYGWPIARPLLELSLAREQSTASRQLFFVTGGLLAGYSERRKPRLEFRTVLGGTYVLAAIQDFTPRLPWLVYQSTQALFHTWVMRSFAKYLAGAGGTEGLPAGRQSLG